MNLEPGDYIVREINPPDYPDDISDQDEMPDGDAGDTDSTVDNRIVVSLNPGEVDEGNNFVDAAAPTFAPTLAPVGQGTPSQLQTAMPSKSPVSEVPETGKVTGIIFEDTNGNGMQDPEEDGIPGVEVVITDSNGDPQTVTTDSNGEYTAVVPSGLTIVDVDETTLPYPDSTQTAGTDPTSFDVIPGGTVSDVDGFQSPTGAPTGSATKFPTSAPFSQGSPSEITTGMPSKQPSLVSPPTVAPSRTCEVVRIDFDSAANGTLISGGRYVQNEWLELGMILAATGGYPGVKVPRLFDTSDTGNELYGDEDLGSPNKGCGGPGIGAGGAPGAPGENCIPQGNVLIVQENNADVTQPDDSADGGKIIFNFTPQVVSVIGVGLMDINCHDLPITAVPKNGSENTTITVKGLGPNSVQDVPLGFDDVIQMVIGFPTDGAVTYIDLCLGAGTAAPSEQKESPMPSPAPSASLTGSPTGTVTGVVFEDKNGNGTKDPGEDGIPNVEVVITDSNGDPQTVTTDSNGEYSASVPPGPTVIDVDETTLPPDAEQTAGTDPTSVDVPSGGIVSDADGYQFPTGSPTGSPTTPSTLAPVSAGPPGEVVSSMPSVFSPTGTVTGVVFEDTNGNGTKDPGEDGIPNVEVVITDSNGDPQTVTTDSNGEYSASVPPGPTVIDVDETTLPPDAEQTAGTDPTSVDVPSGGIVSDADGYQFPTGSPTSSPSQSPAPSGSPSKSPSRSPAPTISGTASPTTSPSPSASPTGSPTGTVTGVVFEDTNGNGTKDPGEDGIPNVEVVITDSNGDPQTVTTDSNGEYSASVPPGPTVIDVDETTLPPDAEQTAGTDPTSVDVPSGGIVSDADGYQFPTGAPSRAPVSPGPPGEVESSMPSKQPTASPAPSGGEKGSIAGSVTCIEEGNTMSPVSGVTIELLDSNLDVVASTTTNGNGDYEFTEVAPGTYFVSESNSEECPNNVSDQDDDPDGDQTDSDTTVDDLIGVTVTPGESDIGNNFVDSNTAPSESPTASPSPNASPTGSPTGTVTGVVFEDTNGNGTKDPGEDGIPNVEVVITDSNGDLQTVTTDSNGEYSASVPPGPTVIDVDETTLPPDAEQTAGTDPTSVDVPSGGIVSDADGYQFPTGSPTSSPSQSPAPSGSPSESPSRSPAPTISGTASPTTSPSPSASPTGSPTGTVTGVVFEDTNGNGTKDPGEDGIPNVEVVITDSNGDPQTVTTDSNGEYSASVPPGPTVIDVDETTLPPDAEQTAGTDPTSVDVPSGGIVSDADGYQFPTGAPSRAPVSPGPPGGVESSMPSKQPTASPAPSGGEKGSIAGSVTCIEEGNTMSPVSGVTIELLDSNLDVVASTTTNGNGDYEFTEVAPGTYFVSESNSEECPNNVSDQDDDPDGDQTDSDTTVDDLIGVTVTPGESDIGNNFVDSSTAPSESPTASPSPNASPTGSPTGTVTGVVFEDTNGNGTKDPGEDGIPNVEVVITDSNGDPQTVTTDSNGEYSASVPPGPTVIDVDETTLPPDAEQTAGTDPTSVDVPSGGIVSDADGYQFPIGSPTSSPSQSPAPSGSPSESPSRSPAPTISGTASPTTSPSPSASPTGSPTGTVTGVVFEDTNGNGTKDPGEDGIPNVEVVITDSNGDPQTVTTDSNGEYSASVPPGPTVIDVDETTLPPDAEQTAGTDPTSVDVPSGGIVSDADGYQFPTGAPSRAPVSPGPPGGVESSMPSKQPTASPAPSGGEKGSIAGSVTCIEEGNTMSPLSGVTIELLDSNLDVVASTTTNGNGDYEFTEVAPGSYFVSESNSEECPNNVSDQDDDPDGDQTDSDTTVDDLIGVTVTPGESDTGNNFVDSNTAPSESPTSKSIA